MSIIAKFDCHHPCIICGEPPLAGQLITKPGSGLAWSHDSCWAFEHNRQQVLAGATYRSQAPPSWRRKPRSSRY